MDLTDIHTQVGLALAGIGTALLMGKAIRRILLLPFEWLARKTDSKVLDVIVDEAEKDLGIDSTLDKAQGPESK